MVTINVVSSKNGLEFTESSYHTNSLEDAKNLVYVIVAYSADTSEKSEITLDYLYDNFESVVGSKEDPLVCELLYEDKEENYHLEIFVDDNLEIVELA